jgi:ketosteroid isomerase-like protein
MLLDQRMRGRSTGIEVPMGEYAHVATFRNGLMVHWTYYASQSQALEAVGLSEQPVSQENVELATRAIDAWNRLDLDSFMEVWHVEAEWRPAFPKGTEGTGSVFRGHDGIRDAWRNVRTAWSVYDVQPQEIRMAGDSLLVLGRIHARGEASGLEIDSDWSAVLRYRDGKLITAWDWLDHRSALEAVGLSE